MYLFLVLGVFSSAFLSINIDMLLSPPRRPAVDFHLLIFNSTLIFFHLLCRLLLSFSSSCQEHQSAAAGFVRSTGAVSDNFTAGATRISGLADDASCSLKVHTHRHATAAVCIQALAVGTPPNVLRRCRISIISHRFRATIARTARSTRFSPPRPRVAAAADYRTRLIVYRRMSRPFRKHWKLPPTPAESLRKPFPWTRTGRPKELLTLLRQQAKPRLS